MPREPGPRSEPADRPADVARRALRAARERRDAEQEASSGAESTTGDADERRGARPSDAARAALRPTRTPGGSGARPTTPPAAGGTDRADSAEGRSGGQAATAGAAADPSPSDTGADPEAPASTSGPRAARPGDAAREALRAAMEDRRRAAAEEEEADRSTPGARRPRRPEQTPPGSVARRGKDAGADSGRARDLRSLLAGAFRMPSEDSPHGDDPALSEPPADRRSEPKSPTPASPSPSTPPARTPFTDSAPPHPAPTAPDSASEPAHETPPPNAVSAPPPAPGLPATPQVPRSMAAPARDGELRRTFPAFAPRPPDDARFAETWWGDAWVTALEEGALDAKRLARGRGYAQEGHVDAITVTPGLVLAYVRGSRPRPYRVQVRLRTLDDADWARFLDTVAERPGHIAALLDKEMPQSLAECGVPLLPGPGDLDPRCSCPDRGHPCKHAAALCYQTARLLDADPFVLLLLRGRGERELLDTLSRLSATRAARAAQDQEPAPLAGVRAAEALDPRRRLPSLPAPLPTPPHPEQPPVYPASPGGPDPFALDQLATDAAVRAHALLATGRDPVAELTLWQDAVRLAAARPGSGLTASTRALYSSLASAADRTPADLARAVAAWRQGGLEGLAVLEEPWDPPAGRFDRARPLLLAADLPAFRPWRNHLTHPRGHVQLRLGRDGLWYPYESEPGHDDWWPRGTPDLDPVGALTGLGAAPES
ncbi:SWIM zinc finger family protein [Streptomyces sp. NPDC093568]|uniref:SWIM zinc finger family protein n=1 Tax=Streptomyces sp. NPDC093568 TaxID=3366041 RepID=UPI00380B2562